MGSDQHEASIRRGESKKGIPLEPKAQEPSTVVTPVEIDGHRLNLRVDCFDSPIDLSKLPNRFASARVLHADPLVVRLPGNSYVVALPFGAVVFWRCAEEVCADVLTKVGRLPGMRPPNREVRDTLPVL